MTPFRPLNATLARHAAVAAALVLLPAAASAQPAAPSAAASPAARAASADPGLSRADRDFLRQAAEAGLTEMQGSRLAVDKGVNTQVKGYAQQLLDDHTRSHEALQALAVRKGIALPDEPSAAQRAKLRLLEAADGGGFDRRYADTVGVDAHRDAVRLFQKAAASAGDPDVRTFASRALPTLQQHLETARELQRVVSRQGNVKRPGDRKQ